MSLKELLKDRIPYQQRTYTVYVLEPSELPPLTPPETVTFDTKNESFVINVDIDGSFLSDERHLLEIVRGTGDPTANCYVTKTSSNDEAWPGCASLEFLKLSEIGIGGPWCARFSISDSGTATLIGSGVPSDCECATINNSDFGCLFAFRSGASPDFWANVTISDHQRELVLPEPVWKTADAFDEWDRDLAELFESKRDNLPSQTKK